MPVLFAGVVARHVGAGRRQLPGAPRGPLRHARLAAVGARPSAASSSASTRAPSSGWTDAADAGRSGRRCRRPRRLHRLGAAPRAAAAARSACSRNRGLAAASLTLLHRLRRDVRHLPGADPVHPGRARLLGADGLGRLAAADDGGHDAAVGDGPDHRQAHRHAQRAHARRRRCSPSAWPCSPPWSRSTGGYWSVLPGLIVVATGIGLCMTPVDDDDHRVAPHREAGRGVGAQRHGARARRRRRHRPARLARQRRLPLERRRRHDELSPDSPAGCRRASARRSPPPVTSAPRRRRSSMPHATPWSTAGACRCGSAWRWPPRPSVYLVARGPRPADSLAEDMLYDEFDQLGELDVVAV